MPRGEDKADRAVQAVGEAPLPGVGPPWQRDGALGLLLTPLPPCRDTLQAVKNSMKRFQSLLPFGPFEPTRYILPLPDLPWMGL